MARAAVIPESPPKRATRGRGKGTTGTKTAGKPSAKVTKAAETRKRNARAAAAQKSHDDSVSEEETDDEIGVIDNKTRGKTAGPRGKSTNSGTGRGRKPAAAAVEADSESENDDQDELAEPEVPKKKAGRPKAKALAKEEGATKVAASSRPRGRPKGTSAKSNTEDDLLKENTRRNARAQESEDLSSSQQGPTEIFIATGSALLRGPAKKKKVTFQEMSDSDEAELSEAPAPTTRRRRGTVVAKDQEGMGAKPVRRAPAPSTRGRKPAAAKKGGTKPLSPKKATQVAKAMSAYASSDGEDDELNGEKDAIKLVVHSPQKHGSGISGLSSPVRRINFSPTKPSKTVDENGEPNLPPPKTFDFGESQFMSSPARRPPPSPFHFTLKETPKRGRLSFNENAKLARPESTPAQSSPLRTSPKKANLGTPKSGSLFGHNSDGITQPNFTPAQNSPLKTLPKKGFFGTSLATEQPSHQASTPFKSSVLLSPAKKVSTPFKSSIPPVSSSLAKESRTQADTETDDETVSMYDGSPLREHNFEGATEFDADERDARLDPDGSPTSRIEHSEKGDLAQPVQEVLSEDEISPLGNYDVAEYEEQIEQEVEDMIEEAEAEFGETGVQEAPDYDRGEDENTTPGAAYDEELELDEFQGQDLEPEQEHIEALEDELDVEVGEKRRPSASRHSLFNGLEDVFTESSPIRNIPEQDNAMNDTDKASICEDEYPVADHSTRHEDNNEPTLDGHATSDHSTGADPVQPYEIEEVEDTPFVSFLLTHWAPTLQCVDECQPTMTPAEYTERRSPRLSTPESDQNDTFTFSISSKQNTPIQPQEASLPNRGPRFTLLAEQFSQWKASSPAKPGANRPRRRGVFSLGRSSDVPSAAACPPRTDIFANAPYFSTTPRAKKEVPTPQAPDVHEELDIHEDAEEPEVDGAVESKPEHSARRPMAEIMRDEVSDAPEEFNDDSHDETEEQQAETANYPAFERLAEPEGNEAISLLPATPAKNLRLPRETYHTVSKVPLKPEGEISPLKISRKRGRSLSITSPVRSSPRLRDFVLPPKERRTPESPPRKSPRVQQGSIRKSLSKETPNKSVEAPQTQRGRTPSRSASASKTPRKQVSPYEYCLNGAVVYVDVHTTEGEDASGIFIELLQQMGAKCMRNWSWNPRMSLSPEEDAPSLNSKVGITHVVFKDGGVRTLEKVRQAGGLVKCVGVGWVLDCERENKWVDEEPYAVDSSIIPRGGAKRRKSMEPRALSNVNGTLIKTDMGGPSTIRRSSAAFGNRTPRSRDDHTPDYEPDHKYWQTPRTPGAAALGFNFDSIGMSPATPFYLSQRTKLVQQTCPPKQTRQGLFSKTSSEEGPFRELKAKLEAARRKSLAFKPPVGSPLVE
ncbi:hypothetical protein BDW62DRAFT_54947 [Aspergillus aurantiobrunneus]